MEPMMALFSISVLIAKAYKAYIKEGVRKEVRISL